MTLSPEFLLKKANFQLSGNSGNHFPNIEWKFFDILFLCHMLKSHYYNIAKHRAFPHPPH